MRLGWPSWIEPVDSLGEWLGFLAGVLIVVAAILAAGFGVVRFASDGAHIARAIPLVACGFDPTDSCNWSVPVVKNDTSNVVVLKPCDHHGGNGDHCGDSIVLRPGTTSPAGDYNGLRAFVGELDWIAVSRRGRRIGCLVVNGHSTKHDGDLVLVSDAGPCGDAATPATRIVGRA